MSPSLRELADVLDWRAVSVLRAIDEAHGATVEELVAATDFSRDRVEDRCRQLVAVGLATETELDGETGYEVTGQGHGAIGEGLYDEFEFVGEGDVDDLAAEVADLLDRRDELAAAVDELREDAESVRERATHQFGEREDVTAEFESLLADVEELVARLDEE